MTLAQPRPDTASAGTPAATALSDQQIVDRVLGGEIELFEILMRRYNQRLYRVALGFVRNPAEAEDVAQEAYVNAFHRLETFRGEAAFATWLTRIAVYEAMARSRREFRLVPLPDDEARPPERSAAAGAGDDPERDTGNHELRAALQQAIEALPPPLRSVFMLREVEGLSSEETARVLELSRGNVRVRLHRAKRQLREELEDRFGREVCRLYRFDGQRCDRIVLRVLARLLGTPLRRP